MPTPRGLRAFGLSAASTNSGAITVRDQYETFSMWNGAHFGIRIASGRIHGTARHGTCSNSARMMRMKTLDCSAPPCARTASRARRICGAWGSSPASFSA